METPLPKLRHDARGFMNAIGLCATALSSSNKPAENLEFLNAVIGACDDLCGVLDALTAESESTSQDAGEN